jgi:hypothetical protein
LVLNSKEWVPNSFLVHKINNCSKKIKRNIDAYRGVRGGVYPTSKIFAKLVNKNAIKHQKGVPSTKIFTTPIYSPSQN